MPKRTKPYWSTEFKADIGKVTIVFEPDLTQVARRFSEHTLGHVTLERAIEIVKREPFNQCEGALKEVLKEYATGDYTRIQQRGRRRPAKTAWQLIRDRESRRVALIKRARKGAAAILGRGKRVTVRALADELRYKSQGGLKRNFGRHQITRQDYISGLKKKGTF